MLQVSTIPSGNFHLLRLVRDSEVLHSRARERREIQWCDDADGRRLPIPHLPSTGLPPLRPLRHTPGWRHCLPGRRCSLHLDGVLEERGEGGQAEVPRRRAACPRRCPAPAPVLARCITSEQSPFTSPRVAVAYRALRPMSTHRAPARRVPRTAPPRSNAAPCVTSHPV
jgi:hypothetical protein